MMNMPMDDKKKDPDFVIGGRNINKKSRHIYKPKLIRKSMFWKYKL